MAICEPPSVVGRASRNVEGRLGHLTFDACDQQEVIRDRAVVALCITPEYGVAFSCFRSLLRMYLHDPGGRSDANTEPKWMRPSRDFSDFVGASHEIGQSPAAARGTK